MDRHSTNAAILDCAVFAGTSITATGKEPIAREGEGTNECFAGLGQLLRDKRWRLQVKQELLDVPEAWMKEPIICLLAEYGL